MKQIARSDAAQDATHQIAKPPAPVACSRNVPIDPLSVRSLDPTTAAAAMPAASDAMGANADAPPLTGIRVVEFAALGPVPVACMMLADSAPMSSGSNGWPAVSWT